MATVEEIRRLLEDEIRPLRSILFSIEEKFSALQKSVDFVSSKYDELLKQIQGSNEKVVTLVSDVKNTKRDLTGVQKRALEVTKDVDDLAQYLRRDCIEISGLKPTESISCTELVKAVGKDMDMELEDGDISTAHPIPRYDKSADEKIIVKFTRRADRDEFYSNRKKVAGKKASSLKSLKDACPTTGVDLNKKIYISESLTPKKKKLFGLVNKFKKELQWKFIWTNHGRIYLKQRENSQTYKIDSPEDFEILKKNILKGARG